jgi:hypothetical protein
MLRGDVIPAAPALLVLGGVTLMLGVNTALYLTNREPPYVIVAGAAAAIAGWIWTNAALAMRSQPAASAAA